MELIYLSCDRSSGLPGIDLDETRENSSGNRVRDVRFPRYRYSKMCQNTRWSSIKLTSISKGKRILLKRGRVGLPTPEKHAPEKVFQVSPHSGRYRLFLLLLQRYLENSFQCVLVESLQMHPFTLHQVPFDQIPSTFVEMVANLLTVHFAKKCVKFTLRNLLGLRRTSFASQTTMS